MGWLLPSQDVETRAREAGPAPREGAASPARVEWTYLLPDLSAPQATTP